MLVVWQWRLNLPANIPLNFVPVRQMTADGQSDKITSAMEVRMKQICVIEVLHAGNIAPNDIHRRLLNVYGDQTVDVSTVRRCVARFSSGDSDVKDKPRSGRPCTAVTPQNEERLDQLIRANRLITARELCTELNIGVSALETMVLSVYIVVSMEINRRHYFRSDPRMSSVIAVSTDRIHLTKVASLLIKLSTSLCSNCAFEGSDFLHHAASVNLLIAVGSQKRVTSTHYMSVRCSMHWRAKYWHYRLPYVCRNLITTY
jgi:transposase